MVMWIIVAVILIALGYYIVNKLSKTNTEISPEVEVEVPDEVAETYVAENS